KQGTRLFAAEPKRDDESGGGWPVREVAHEPRKAFTTTNCGATTPPQNNWTGSVAR
ncbi:unnamed protein product, partial [Ectocarpus sp. 12 AP-2014]